MLVRPYEYIVGRLNGTFLYNNPSYKPPSEARKAVDNVQMLLERQVKLKEFQTLAEKVYPSDIARQAIIAANYQATILEDDASLGQADVLLKNSL